MIDVGKMMEHTLSNEYKKEGNTKNSNVFLKTLPHTTYSHCKKLVLIGF